LRMIIHQYQTYPEYVSVGPNYGIQTPYNCVEYTWSGVPTGSVDGVIYLRMRG